MFCERGWNEREFYLPDWTINLTKFGENDYYIKLQISWDSHRSFFEPIVKWASKIIGESQPNSAGPAAE